MGQGSGGLKEAEREGGCSGLVSEPAQVPFQQERVELSVYFPLSLPPSLQQSCLDLSGPHAAPTPGLSTCPSPNLKGDVSTPSPTPRKYDTAFPQTQILVLSIVSL